MNILFISVHFEENYYYYKLACKLKREGLSLCFVSLSRKAALDMKKCSERVTAMPDLLGATEDVVKTDENTIAQIEKDYELISLKETYLADRGLWKRPEAERVRRTANYFLAWENYFDNHNVDCVFTDVGPELIRRVGAWVCRRRGIPCIFISCLPFFNELTLSFSDFYQVDPAISKDLKLLTEAQRQKVADYVNYMKTERPVTFTSPFKITFKRIRRLLEHIWIAIFVEKYEHEHFYKFQHIKRIIRARMNRHFLKLLYKRADFNERYIYYPLHAGDDFSLTVKAPHGVV